MTTAIRNTVTEYSRPLSPPSRGFSESHISKNIRSRHANQVPCRDQSSTSDADDSASSSSTLNPEFTSASLADVPAAKVFPDPENITSATIDRHLYTAGNPPLDLLVRTSGVERLSDFMLWQCHQQTEVVFLSCLWPEFDLWHFLPVLLEWQWRWKTARRVESMTVNSALSQSLKDR